MPPLYQVILLGSPARDQISAIQTGLRDALEAFGLSLQEHLRLDVTPDALEIDHQRTASIVFFGGDADTSPVDFEALIDDAIPIIPIVSSASAAASDLPDQLRHLNALDYVALGPERIVATVLESLSLLPHQRRVFLSYRRSEARGVAVQLFDVLSSRVFDIFLDTHGIPPATDFQSVLWHRLCDSDVMVMLDTHTYFESRWTSAEFGRALAKGIPILRIGWPDSEASPRTATCSHISLGARDFDASGSLVDSALDAICRSIESLRSRSFAIRRLNMVSSIREALYRIGGRLDGVGHGGVVAGTLPDGAAVRIYPALGVPTARTLHRAEGTAGGDVAVAFDHVGLQPDWLEHLEWLGSHIRTARWVRVAEAAWCFADWDA